MLDLFFFYLTYSVKKNKTQSYIETEIRYSYALSKRSGETPKSSCHLLSSLFFFFFLLLLLLLPCNLCLQGRIVTDLLVLPTKFRHDFIMHRLVFLQKQKRMIVVTKRKGEEYGDFNLFVGKKWNIHL